MLAGSHIWCIVGDTYNAVLLIGLFSSLLLKWLIPSYS